MIRKALIAALALLAGCGQPPADPAKPESYALTLNVNPADGDGVQRVALPLAAVAALQRADGGDVRIFDNEGRTLSLARLDQSGLSQTWQSHNVDVIPVAMDKPAAPASVTVNIESAAQNVTVDAVNAEAAAEANPPAALLLDARKLRDPVIALQLDAVIPRGKLVSVSVAASGDLKVWEPLAEKVLVGRDKDMDSQINLPGVPLKDRFIRISWQLDEDVIIRGAKVITGKTPPPRPLAFATTDLVLADPHLAEFVVPLGVPISGIRVTGRADDGVIPLSLFGRETPEGPWSELTLGALHGAAPSELAMPPARMESYQLRADKRSAGMANAPQIMVLTEPIVLLAAFNGKPPYRLAVGLADAPNTLFKPRELLGPGAKPVADLSEASVASTAPPVLSLASPVGEDRWPWRKIALWGVLLLATAILAMAARRLLRAGNNAGEAQ